MHTKFSSSETKIKTYGGFLNSWGKSFLSYEIQIVYLRAWSVFKYIFQIAYVCVYVSALGPTHNRILEQIFPNLRKFLWFLNGIYSLWHILLNNTIFTSGGLFTSSSRSQLFNLNKLTVISQSFILKVTLYMTNQDPIHCLWDSSPRRKCPSKGYLLEF